MRRWTKVAAAASLLAAVAAAAFFRSRFSVPVDVFEARKEAIEEIGTADSAGTGKSIREATMSAEANGRASEVLVAGGDTVRKGQILARLSDRELAKQAAAWGIRLLDPKLPVEIPAWAIVLRFTFSVFVGMFIGVYPARKAASPHPIEALRYE